MTDLQKEINKISDILTLPDVVTRINTLVRDPNTSAADITMVISSDLALSAKVLKLVNSPFYGFNRRITSINYAIVILGFNAIRNLAMSAFMFDLYRSRVEGFDSREFWRFSICCAAGAQAVAQKANFPHGDDAFMGGLLHNIGVVVMNQYFREDFARSVKHCIDADVTLLEAEQAVLDYDHRDVGALLLDRWNLPEEMTGVCRGYAEIGPESDRVCAVVHLAHVLATALCLGNPGHRRILPLCPQALDLLRIEPEELPEYVDAVIEAAQGIESFLSIDEE